MHNTAAHGPLNDNHENQQSIGRWDFVAWTEREWFFVNVVETSISSWSVHFESKIIQMYKLLSYISLISMKYSVAFIK